MQWVLYILQKHLANERKWLNYESIAIDAKTKAGVKMAKVRVPQLEKAIEILKQTPEVSKTPDKPKRPRTKTQLSLWQILNPES